MRRVFLRYFLSILAIAVVVLFLMFGMLLFQYGVSQEQWKNKVYDDFVVSVENAVNDGDMAGYGLSSILMAVSNIDDDRISGFILRDIEGTSVVMFDRSPEGGRMTSSVVPQLPDEATKNGEPTKVKNATRIDVKSTYDESSNVLSLTSVLSVVTKNVEISMPANLRNEGVIGSVMIAVDGTDAFIIDLLTFTPRTYKYSKDIINSCIKALFISLPIGLVIAALAAWVISSRNTKYINDIRKALNDLSHGKSDVSIPKQRNNELNEITVAIEDLDKNLKSNAKSRQAWLSSISHDLNTPTTAMKMIIDGLNDGVFPADEETLKELQRENDTLSDRIGRVIDYSSLQADTKAVIDDVNTEQFIDELLVDLKVGKGVSFTSDCDVIRCDAGLMSRAVRELLRNAVESNGNADIPVRLAVREDDGFYEIQVVNDGKIPQEMDVDFFEPWARGDWSRTSGGSGLGLPIAATILALHNGTVSLKQITPDMVSAVARWPKA